MNIPTLILAAIAVLMIVAVAFGLTMALCSYLRYRGKRVITCPETANHAAVHANVVNAAREAAFGKHHICLDQCSRQNCGQACLPQIEAHPKGCMVWHMVDDWYKGKACTYCQKPFHEIHWHDRQPDLLGPDRNTAQWSEIPPENLPSVFRISFQCAGIASSRKTTGVSIPNGWRIADGNVGWVASMFPRNPRRIFRRNQPAATKRALKVALGATPFKLPQPHQSLVTR